MPLKSFLDVPSDSDFPLENLPFGTFKPRAGGTRIGVAIGQFVLDLSILEELGHFRAADLQREGIFACDSLNDFLALGRPAWPKLHRETRWLPVKIPAQGTRSKIPPNGTKP
jgi:fumarylacetoacetase